MATTDDPFQPGRAIGPYEILRELGRGGMGRVYLAKDTAVGDRLVAIKVILSAGRDEDDQAHVRFFREIKSLARLRHNHIVTIFTAGNYLGHPYFVMDYIPGRDLGRFLDECSMLAEQDRIERIVKVMAAVARAVHYAHGKEIVHRDLKPANILITHEADEPMVLDFGIAKYLGDTSLTEAGNSPGTPAYRAPEQIDVRLKLRNELIDVWALGVILYRALTGTHPFKGVDFLSLSVQILNTDPDPPRVLNPKIPAAVEKVVLSCLQKQPERRPGTALAVAEQLDQSLSVRVPHFEVVAEDAMSLQVTPRAAEVVEVDLTEMSRDKQAAEAFVLGVPESTSGPQRAAIGSPRARLVITFVAFVVVVGSIAVAPLITASHQKATVTDSDASPQGADREGPLTSDPRDPNCMYSKDGILIKCYDAANKHDSAGRDSTASRRRDIANGGSPEPRSKTRDPNCIYSKDDMLIKCWK